MLFVTKDHNNCYEFITLLDKNMNFCYNLINTCYGTSG